jgi:multicomponent Na+:H+ antiporter subunit E
VSENEPHSRPQTTGNQRRSGLLSRAAVFLVLALFWILLSGKLDAFHLTLGAVSCLLVSLVSHDLLFENIRSGKKFATFFRFCAYVPWLMWQIVLANLHVAWLVLSPKGIDPRVTRVKSKLKTDFAKVTFGNSITLTPGTITMDIEGDTFYVHSLSKKVADDLDGGDMEQRVAHVFDEEKTS